jgi:hypothetical protein
MFPSGRADLWGTKSRCTANGTATTATGLGLSRKDIYDATDDVTRPGSTRSENGISRRSSTKISVGVEDGDALGRFVEGKADVGRAVDSLSE